MKQIATLAFLMILSSLAQAKQYTLFQAAVVDDPATRGQAIAVLREIGPKGLANLLDQYRDPIDRQARGEKVEHWDRISAAIDAVAQQKDAHASGLYWYTDLEKAKSAARELNRPILSLRLLGTLDCDLSCANSRFFRTALYANAEVSKYLRENYVLHWQSVRPVPRITIDFGDGRKIERTITGNSIHYVLDSDGRPIDGIPGLYGPAAFLARVQAAASVASYLSKREEPTSLRQWHRQRAAAITAQWNAELHQLGKAPRDAIDAKRSAQPTAAEAARVAVSKTFVEARPLLAIDSNLLVDRTDAETWQQLAALHASDAHLDTASRRLMRDKLPAEQASELSISKRAQESPLLKIVRNFERSIAEDTVRNEYLLHRQIHDWFASGSVKDVDTLNERVYSELFLTPSSDPWLGLLQEETYTALEDGGVLVGK